MGFLEILSRVFSKDEYYDLAELTNPIRIDSEFKSFPEEKILILRTSGNTESKEEMFNDDTSLKKHSKPTMRKQLPKWLTTAWDAYRTVESHRKGGMFKKPFIPSNETLN